jgi:Ca2+-binding RTX toxin-like protein
MATRQGGPGDDHLTGTAGNDSLDGRAGNDRLTGLAGIDSLRGGTGGDALFGELGADSLDGGEGDDVGFGGDGDDVLLAGAGDDALSGGPGDDLAVLAAGADELRLGAGADVVRALLAEPGEGTPSRIGLATVLDLDPGEDALDLQAFGVGGDGVGLELWVADFLDSDDDRRVTAGDAEVHRTPDGAGIVLDLDNVLERALGLDPALPDQRVVLAGVTELDVDLVGPGPDRLGPGWLGEDGVHLA